MSKEFYEKLLKSFSKSNTLRKQKISSDAGMTVEEYKNFLKQNIAGTVSAVVVDIPVTATEFTDMELSKGTSGTDARMRQVDTRSIQYLIVNKVKYTLKK